MSSAIDRGSGSQLRQRRALQRLNSEQLSAVTSVGLIAPSIFVVSGSPVTTTGNFTLTLATEPANKFFLGPTLGAAATPTFRGIVPPDLNLTTPGDMLYVAPGAGPPYTVQRLAAGSPGNILSTVGGFPTWIGNPGGTITIVGLVVPPEFTVTGSPLSGGGGTLTIAKANENSNTIWAGPTLGAAAAPAFRALVAADIPAAIPRVLFSGQNSTAIANTVTETAFSTNYSAAGGSLNVLGRKLRWMVYFSVQSTNAFSDAITLKLKLGTMALCTFSSIMVGGAAAGTQIRLEASTVVTVTGAAGSVQAAGIVFVDGLDSVATSPTATAAAIDLTASATVAVSATWSVASANCSITIDDIVIEQVF